MGKRRLLVYSIDAMFSEDLGYIRTLPNLGRMFEDAGRVERMTTVYPSVTYPAHVSMASGAYPAKHGIVNNELFRPTEKRPPWEWYAKSIRVDTIFDAAHRANYKTCAVNWPVTGGTDSIDYVVNEIWTQYPGEDPVAPHVASGASEETLAVIRRYAHILDSNRHPQIDEFGVRCACDIIREYAPEVVFVHQAYVDNNRHRNGLFNEKVNESLERSDRWFGELLEAVAASGHADDTDVVVTSDHGQLEIKRVVHPNVILADNGLIRTDAEGNIAEWDAFVNPVGMCAEVWLRPDADEALWQRTYELLCRMRDEGVYGFTDVFTEAEARERHHLGGGFAFVLESDGYTSFGKSARRPLVTSFDLSDYKYGRATHGFLPEKGPKPPFLVKGPHFAADIVIPAGEIVDEAPTYARLLGVELPEADGKVIEALLK